MYVRMLYCLCSQAYWSTKDENWGIEVTLHGEKHRHGGVDRGNPNTLAIVVKF